MWEDVDAWITVGWISAVVIVMMVAVRLGAEKMGFHPSAKPRDSLPPPLEKDEPSDPP